MADDADNGQPTEAPPPSPPPSGSNLRTVGIAVLASLLTGLVAAGGTGLTLSMGERSRTEAAEAECLAQVTAAKTETAEVRRELEALHQRQALYVAHTSIVRAMQELDQSNYGSAGQLVKHAGEALEAADPATTGTIKKAVQTTNIDVSEDRIAQLNRLRLLAKQLQAAM